MSEAGQFRLSSAGSPLGVRLLLPCALLLVGPAVAQNETITIAEALRTTNGDNVPDRLGQVVTIVGVLTAQPRMLAANAYQANLQDATSGVALFSRDPAILPLDRLHRGDILRVRGAVAQYKGQKEVVVQEILPVGQGEPPVPRQVQVADLNSERFSGQLVRVAGELVAGARADRALLSDPAGKIEVALFRPLAGDLKFVERVLKGGRVEIVGIASQRKNEPPFDSGYQLLPRDSSDLQFTPVPPYRAIGATVLILACGFAYLWERRRSAARARRTRELTVFTRTLEEQAKQLRLQADELVHARDAALTASRLKSEFLANMSHEIRTPINGIMGMISLALDTELDPIQQDYLKTAETCSDSLLILINDILDFSKIEAGMLTIDPIRFVLREMLAGTMTILESPAQLKGLDLSLDVAPDVPGSLFADPVRLRQILLNLLGNAVKFTAQGRVALQLSLDDGQLHFSITDTGIGISREHQECIFDAFVQADGSTTRRFGGTGLGLAISSRLVELMGGRIWVESDPGLGSTFHFAIPVCEAPEPEPSVPGASESYCYVPQNR